MPESRLKFAGKMEHKNVVMLISSPYIAKYNENHFLQFLFYNLILT